MTLIWRLWSSEFKQHPLNLNSNYPNINHWNYIFNMHSTLSAAVDVEIVIFQLFGFFFHFCGVIPCYIISQFLLPVENGPIKPRCPHCHELSGHTHRCCGATAEMLLNVTRLTYNGASSSISLSIPGYQITSGNYSHSSNPTVLML